MSCEITLTDKIKIKNQTQNSFSSEEEFDTWLFQNRVAIKRKLKLDNDVNSPTFAISLTPVESRLKTWDAFRDKMVSLHTNPALISEGINELVTIGTTTLFKYVGNKNNINTPVNDFSENKADFIKKWTGEGKTISEAEALWKQRDRRNALIRLDGNIFGALVEDALTGTTNSLDYLRKRGLMQDLSIAGITFDQAVNRIKSTAQNVINEIRNNIIAKYGTNAKIFSEVEVISKELGSDFKAALSAASLKSGKQKTANAVQGFLDLVIQTESGELHTYDVKLSTYKAKDWWSSTESNWKYNEISAQQMAYATMARQWGINFNSVNIIPAYVEYDDDGNIKSINSEEFRTFSLTNPYALACERYFPVHTKTDSITIKNLSKLMDELYPGLQLDTKAQTIQMSKDFVIKNIIGARKSDGKYHLQLDDNTNAILGKEITFNTEEERDKYIEEVYIPEINEKYSKELRSFGNALRDIANSKNNTSNKTDQLFEMARGISKNKETQEWIVNKFKKYAIQGWDLVSDDDNLLADYGIFIFTRNGLAEIVMMDKTDLYGVVQMGKAKNTTVLGMLKHDLAEGMDDTVVLKALRGHLMAMKAAAFISQNETTLFNGLKVQAVKAINLHWKQAVDVNNDMLLNNWNMLCAYYNIENSGKQDKTTLRTIGKNTFLSTALAYVNQADDIANTFLDDVVNFKGHENYLSIFADEPAEDILRYINNLKSAYSIANESDWTKHSDAFEAYNLLSKAYCAVRGFQIAAQNGIGDYISNGIFLTGARSSSPAESNSPAIRIFNQIEPIYEQKLRDEYRKFSIPWQNQMLKVYQENNIEGIFDGNERDLFKMCFEQDDAGNIAEEFCLIPPEENRFLDNKPELKKLVKMFLETINEVRIPDESERENLSMHRHSLYYQVPLTEASFRQKVKQSNLIDAVKQYAQNTFEEMRDFAYGKPLSSWQIKKIENLSNERVYDPYLDASSEAQDLRKQQLSGNYIVEDGVPTKKKYGVNTFELSLDTIFLRSMASALRASVSKEFMPLFNGLRVILSFNENVDGAALEKVRIAIRDLIRTSVFGKNIIDPDNQRLYKIISIFRNVTSTAALAFNTVSFTREQLTSALRTSLNKTVDPLMKDQFSQSDYVDAMWDIIQHAPENINVQSKYMQLNFIYGLANASEEHLAEASKSGWLKPSNWTSDLLFWTSTSPDFVHRNAILQAVLKHRGSFDAYEMTENNELIYNMDKDKFYEIFWKYKDRYSEIQSKEDKIKFKQQEQFYMNALKDWNKRYGLNLKYKDPLPQALSPTEANGIRVYADHMYGNYDKNTKSLLQRSLVGSIIFQFKTYTLQRFLQSFRDTGHINVTRQRQMTADDGEKLYFVASDTPDEFAKYGAGRPVKESELDEETLKNKDKVEVMTQFSGSPTSGKFETNIELMHDIFYDRDKFMENWKNNGVYRANLYLALMDNFGMLIMMLLLKLIYGEETIQDLYNQDWWTRWSYTVLMGVAQDGPIDQVVGGLVGGGTPPSIAVLQSFFKNAGRIINGEDTAIYGFMNSFGATRQFAGMFANAR